MALLSPGWYEYVDLRNGPTRPLRVSWVGAELIARFPPCDEREAADVPVIDLAGEFRLLSEAL